MRGLILGVGLVVATLVACGSGSKGPSKAIAQKGATGPTSTSSPGTNAGPGAGRDGGGAGEGAGGGGGAAPGDAQAQGDAALSAPEQGIATYYGADGTGNCSFDASPNDLMVAAMNVAQYDNSAVCGECVRIVGPNATIAVRIVDQCPDCVMGQLDLSEQAFAKIADVSAGRVPITWQVVPCDVTGPIQYRFKDGSSQYWTAIQVLNAKLPIATLEWLDSGSYASIERESYDYFVLSSGVGTTGPFQVRVTSSTGEQLVDTLPGVMAGMTVSGAAQFP